TPDAAPPPSAPAPPPPSPAPAAPPPPISAAAAEEIVAAHNFWRRQVKTEPLVWSDELARAAREWAVTLMRQGKFEHRPDSPYGQNIAWFAGERLKPTDVVDYWGNEIEYYDYEKNACLEESECRHYTQIVWKDSREVGCASAWGQHPQYGVQEFWVCNYSPPGNVEGLRPY
ncbi:MAG TPA: CAP domain-containing protein, partial [Nevskiales bacterium]|nr:CAP domain-containing protein [Nevskiales bacterium]